MCEGDGARIQKVFGKVERNVKVSCASVGAATIGDHLDGAQVILHNFSWLNVIISLFQVVLELDDVGNGIRDGNQFCFGRRFGHSALFPACGNDRRVSNGKYHA